MFKIFVYLVGITLLGLAVGQLLTPMMVCEMQQMKLKGLGSGVSYNDTEMQNIRDYCLKHAYDHLGNMGTLG